MKKAVRLLTLTISGVLALTSCSPGNKPAEKRAEEPVIDIKTDVQKAAYSSGVDNAQSLKQQFQGINIDLKALSEGFIDETHQRPKRFSENDIGQGVQAMRRRLVDKVETKIEPDKAGYSVGVDHANNLQKQFQGSDVDLAAFGQGLSDELNGRPKKISPEEIEKHLKAAREKMIDQMMAEGMKAKKDKTKAGDAARNLATSKMFLEENARKEGVKTTSSGLQYTITKEGDGARPSINDRVTVHYQGSLLDGKVFDSSYVRNQPMTFGLSEVIKGWTEGLQLMKAGSKYKFFIPPDLGYGEDGAGALIGPNSVLVFDVELLKIEK